MLVIQQCGLLCPGLIVQHAVPKWQVVSLQSSITGLITYFSAACRPSGSASEQDTQVPVLPKSTDTNKDPFTLFRNAALTFSNLPAIYQRHRPGSPNVSRFPWCLMCVASIKTATVQGKCCN